MLRISSLFLKATKSRNAIKWFSTAPETLRPIPKTMKAAMVKKYGDVLHIENIPVPSPSQGQVLIQVHCCGVCHTDLHAVMGEWPSKPKLPLIPGHEAAGLVAATGPGVVGLKVGDRVGVPWLHSACGICEFCLTSRETLCISQQNTGYSVDGGYAEYMLASAPYVGKIPKEVDFVTAAPILCAGVTTYKGLKETQAKAGEWVAIYGIGGLGHLAVQYAIAMGLKVVALDIRDDCLELAKSYGAKLTVNTLKQDPVEVVQREIGGAHGCLVTAVSPKAFNQAIGTLRRGGIVSLVGLPPGDFPTPIFPLVLQGLRIQGSIVGTRKDLMECMDFAKEGKVKPRVQEEPLSSINDIFKRMREGKITGRIVIDPTK